jgi:hypothetical protein
LFLFDIDIFATPLIQRCFPIQAMNSTRATYILPQEFLTLAHQILNAVATVTLYNLLSHVGLPEGRDSHLEHLRCNVRVVVRVLEWIYRKKDKSRAAHVDSTS